MKNSQKWLGMSLASLIGFSAITPIFEPVTFVHATSSIPFNDDVKKAYDNVLPLVTLAEETKSEKDTQKAYEEFVKMSQLFILSDQLVYKEGNEMDKLYERILKLIDGTPQKNKHLVQFANKWVDEMKNNTSSIMSFYLEDFLNNNSNSAIQKDIDLAGRKLHFYQTMPPGTDLPKDWHQPANDQSKKHDKTNAQEVIDNPNSAPEAKTEVEEVEVNETFPDTQSIEYVQEGEDWYEVTVKYKNGVPSVSDKRKLSKDEAPHLYQTSDSGNGSSYDDGYTSDKFPDFTQTEIDYLLEDQNEDSKHTIQYSLEKQDDSPYYFDTGLRVNDKKNASYEQYKDVLYQIAVKSNGYLVEDKGRVLVVIDKKPILVADIQKEYSKKEIESLFEQFPNIDIRILETRIGTSNSLEHQLVSKQANKVLVDGKEVELPSTPIVRDSRVLLPIKEIAKEMGATLEQKEDTFILSKDKDTVVYQLKSTKIVVKGKEVDINIAPDVKEETLYVDMSETAKAFGYDIVWDGDSSELSFTKE